MERWRNGLRREFKILREKSHSGSSPERSTNLTFWFKTMRLFQCEHNDFKGNYIKVLVEAPDAILARKIVSSFHPRINFHIRPFTQKVPIMLMKDADKIIRHIKPVVKDEDELD